MKRYLLSLVLVAAAAVGSAFAGQPKAAQATTAPPASTTAAQTDNDDALRLQGEQRYRTNCGRCHQAPHKYPPRMMATFLRHMRVRALITDEGMRLILKYMTQ